MLESTEADALQASLRAALQAGSLAGVKSVLEPQKPTWKTSFRNLVRGQVCATPSAATAKLDYVYSDDNCNLPVHFLATGRPAHGVAIPLHCKVQQLLSLLRNTDEQQDQARAQITAWLTAQGNFLDVGAVNANLDTSMHCAVKSASSMTMQALLLMASAQGQPLEPIISCKNVQDLQALDLALEARQWFAVQLLIQAGALSHSPALDEAREQLQEAMPAQQPVAQSSLASLVSGVGKVFSALLGPTLPPPPDPTTASSSSQQPQSLTQACVPAHMASAAPSSSAAAHNPFSDLSTTIPQAPESVVYTVGTIGSGNDGQGPVQQVAPLLILPDLVAVLHWRQECVQQMASQCCVHESVAVLLLDRHQGNAERAYKSWGNSHQGALQQCGMPVDMAAVVLSNNQAHAPAAANVQCMVCFEDISSDLGSPRCTVDLLCHHCTCDTCWQGILEAALSEGDMKQVACPHPSCRLPLPFQLALSLLNSSQAERYQQLLAQHHVDTNPYIKWCPASDCSCSVALQCSQEAASSSSIAQAVVAGRAVDVTCSCGHAFCFACLAPAHEPATCQQAQQWEALLVKAREDDKLNAMQWVQSNTQPCPSCGAPIQRNGGCNHISCTVCRHHFCWVCSCSLSGARPHDIVSAVTTAAEESVSVPMHVCGGNWTDHNMNTGGSWRCNLAAAPPSDPSTDPAGNPTNPAGSNGTASSNLFAAVFGRVADAGMKWRLEHFMRRYLAHECSQRQLTVSMQWLRALLQSGLPRAMWHSVQQSPQLQQQQSLQQHQQPQDDEAVAGSSNTAGDSIASPRPRRPQDLGLKSLLGTSSSTTILKHQPWSMGQASAAQQSDQGHVSLDLEQHVHHRQQHLQAQTLTLQRSDSQHTAGPPQQAGHGPQARLAPAAHMHHMASANSHVHHTQFSGHPDHLGANATCPADQDSFAYMQDLAEELILCRRILQSSYVLGYYLQGTGEQHRLLESFQTQLTGLVEQLSVCLAMLPGSDSLLQASADTLSQQLSSVPSLQQNVAADTSSSIPCTQQPRVVDRAPVSGPASTADAVQSAATPQAAPCVSDAANGNVISQLDPLHMMAAAIRAITKASAPPDGSLQLAGGGLGAHKQFMFAVAVHERAGLIRHLLEQLKAARQGLLQASHTGAFDGRAGATPDAKVLSAYARPRLPIEQAPSIAQVAQNVKFLWQGLV